MKVKVTPQKTGKKTASAPAPGSDAECDHYVNLLLSLKIRLTEIPIQILRDPRHCTRLFVSAFRVDHAISKKQYALDLAYLEAELEQAILRNDFSIKHCLEGVRIFAQPWYETLYGKERSE